MKQAFFVNIFQSFQQGNKDGFQFILAWAGMVLHPFMQGVAAQIGHDEVGCSIGFEQVRDLDDVRVAELVEQLSLFVEALQAPIEQVLV